MSWISPVNKWKRADRSGRNGEKRKSDDSTDASTEGGGSVIECHVDDGCLYTDITGDNVLEWKYLDFDSSGIILDYEDNTADGYHSYVHSDEDIDEGERLVVSGAYEDSNPNDTDDPLYYCVVRVTIDNYNIVDAEEPVFVDSLSDYDYD